jgi:putative chitinase
MSTSLTGLHATLTLRALRGGAPTGAPAPATSPAAQAAHAQAAPTPAPAKVAPPRAGSAPALHPEVPAAPEQHGAAVALVTLAQLRAVMTQLAAAKAQLYVGPLDQALGEFLVDDRLRICAFLGQVAHESGELAWFHEFASGMEYDLSVNPRKARELGNVNPGDGPRYKGRGPIQLTGRNNYRACGRALGLDLEGNPDIAVQPNVAFRTAGWFWSTHGLNALADQSSYREITRRINGGYNGYADRVKYYDRALAIFPVHVGAAAPAHPNA